jgi:hypothetical protein
MNAYCIKTPGQTVWLGTRAEAAKYVKTEYHKYEWPDTYVDLVAIPTDRDSLIQLLNDGTPASYRVLRSWEVSARGGLKEINDA